MTNLEALRNGKGWSRMQLCKIIGRGVTVRMIFSYEREGVNPDIDLLIALPIWMDTNELLLWKP